jgi:hypothetical protein
LKRKNKPIKTQTKPPKPPNHPSTSISSKALPKHLKKPTKTQRTEPFPSKDPQSNPLQSKTQHTHSKYKTPN